MQLDAAEVAAFMNRRFLSLLPADAQTRLMSRFVKWHYCRVAFTSSAHRADSSVITHLHQLRAPAAHDEA